MGMQETMRALADPTRREILNLLKGGRLSAGEITEHFPMTAAAVSRHLSVLKEADLIRTSVCSSRCIFFKRSKECCKTMLCIMEIRDRFKERGRLVIRKHLLEVTERLANEFKKLGAIRNVFGLCVFYEGINSPRLAVTVNMIR